MNFERRIFYNKPIQIIFIYSNFNKNVWLFYNWNMTKKGFLILKFEWVIRML